MPAITLGNLTIDRDRYEAWVDNQRIDLTYVEFELLYALARNASKVMSRERLIAAVWSEPSQETRKLTVHVSRLRRKLSGSFPWRIETVTKRGYVLKQALPDAPPFRTRSMRTAGAPQRALLDSRPWTI